jgi:hypothetical protein
MQRSSNYRSLVLGRSYPRRSRAPSVGDRKQLACISGELGPRSLGLNQGGHIDRTEPARTASSDHKKTSFLVDGSDSECTIEEAPSILQHSGKLLIQLVQ